MRSSRVLGFGVGRSNVRGFFYERTAVAPNYAVETERLLGEFVAYLGSRWRSQSTCEDYCLHLRAFFSWLGESVEPLSVRSEQLAAYRVHLDTTDLSIATIRLKLSALRTFYAWLAQSGRVRENPAAALRQMPILHLPRVLTLDEVRNFFSSIDGSSWQGLRDRAMLEAIYALMLGDDEVTAVRMSDFDESAGVLLGHSLPQSTQYALACYCEALRQRAGPSGSEYLFPTSRLAKCRPRSVQRRIDLHLARQGKAPKAITTAVLRHSRMTHLLLTGAADETSERLLGLVSDYELRPCVEAALQQCFAGEC